MENADSDPYTNATNVIEEIHVALFDAMSRGETEIVIRADSDIAKKVSAIWAKVMAGYDPA